MDLYDIFKLLHVLTSVIWVGGGLLIVVLVTRSILFDDDATIVSVGRLMSFAGEKIFIPASLATLILGIVATFIGGLWGETWIYLGLVGIALTLAIGITQIGPRMKAFEIAHAAEGPTPAVAARCRDVLRIARFDVVALLVVVADMVLKPSSGDLVIIFLLIGVLVAAAVLFLQQKVFDRAPAA